MADKYVSTTGSDGAAGSIGAPWLTWQWAVDHVSPGDTINVSPGTYAPSGTANGAVQITANGTSGSPITLQGNGGIPVLSGFNLTPDNDTYLFDLRADWWIVQDIDVTGAQQYQAGYIGAGILLHDAANNIVRRVRSYANEGPGIVLGLLGATVTNNLVQNCDVYDCYEQGNDGGNSDGFYCQAGGTGNILEFCRSWHNSDDGYDLWEAEASVTLRGCWSWDNGYDAGNGAGFKLGWNDLSPMHLVHNCLALNNLNAGFDTNRATGPIQFYNNTAYGNRYGFALAGTKANASTPVVHILRNNISAQNTDSQYAGTSAAGSDATFNSWNLGVTVNSADFVSIDEALASAARAADGSLPVNGLFRLVAGSDLRDAGTNVGLPFNGAAPDLGAFESGAALVYRALRRV